ncbi:MAG: phosphatidate cytidylyltransferase [Deltaproteobacteria bacterium]|nr:phosphatidate cytidylyltransferase [Deltaproteobacteria bacterium]
MAQGGGSGALVKRVFAAFFLIPAIVFVVVYTAPFWVFASASGLVYLALVEYNNLSPLPARRPAGDKLGVIVGLAMPAVFFFLGKDAVLPVLIAAVVIFFLYGMWGMWSGLEFRDASMEVAFRTLGVIYIAVPLSYFIFLRAVPDGRWWILFILVVVWANDTFAYVVGKTLGRHKLAPRISPGKTIEGAAGGLVAGVAAALICNGAMGLGAGMLLIAAIAIKVGVLGIIGDLAESLLKRGAGVKDSGSLIPGHGGVLDRIDSLIFPVPVLFYILVYYIQA